MRMVPKRLSTNAHLGEQSARLVAYRSQTGPGPANAWTYHVRPILRRIWIGFAIEIPRPFSLSGHKTTIAFPNALARLRHFNRMSSFLFVRDSWLVVSRMPHDSYQLFRLPQPIRMKEMPLNRCRYTNTYMLRTTLQIAATLRGMPLSKS